MRPFTPARWTLLGIVALAGIAGAIGFSGGATSATPPLTCLAGKALNFSKTSCVACPVGYYTDYDGAQCTSTSIDSCCLKCPDGNICPSNGTSKPQMCPANTAANFQKTDCIRCANGFNSVEASQCTTADNRMDSCCQPN